MLGIILRLRLRSGLLTFLAGLFAVGLYNFSNSSLSEDNNLMPALQSIWLELHVLSAVIAYGLFTVSFFLAILYFLHNIAPKKCSSLSPDRLDVFSYQAIIIGFIFLTLVLITGAIWAESVWGRWWSWDPKETWALITWIIYAGYLHARRTHGWKGRKLASLAIIGFLLVLFTLFGVSLFTTGYHNY